MSVISPTKDFNLINAAGHAHISAAARNEVTEAGVGEHSFHAGLKPKTKEEEEKKKKDADEKAGRYLHAVATSSNIALEIGSFAFSALEVSGALDNWADFQQNQLELAKMIDDANQNIYMRHADGTLFTPEEIAAYEDQNLVCVANPYDLANDISTIQSNIAAANQAKALLDSGQNVDLNTLPKAVADQLVTQRIEQQIANGETVDLSRIPPEFKNTAISAVINSEIEGAGIAEYQKLGLTEQDFRNGTIFTDAHADLRDQYMDGMNSWQQARRAELSAQAGVDYTSPAPSADTTTAPSTTMTAPGQDTGTAFNLNDPSTFMPPPSAGM